MLFLLIFSSFFNGVLCSKLFSFPAWRENIREFPAMSKNQNYWGDGGQILGGCIPPSAPGFAALRDRAMKYLNFEVEPNADVHFGLTLDHLPNVLMYTLLHQLDPPHPLLKTSFKFMDDPLVVLYISTVLY